MKRRGLSLTEVTIALFLLSSVALVVFSMSRMAFVRQRRNQHAVEATLIAQSTLNEARNWALDPDHFLGDWSAYQGDLGPAQGVYTVSCRALQVGRGLYSPCAGLEDQWQGPPDDRRVLPRAVVPLEVKVRWSNKPADCIRLLGYIGEPRRDTAGWQIEVNPVVASLATGNSLTYSVTVKDALDRPFQNLLFDWNVDSDYLRIDGQRDGRRCTIVRDVAVVAPTPPTPPLLPAKCTAEYAGTLMGANRAIQLP